MGAKKLGKKEAKKILSDMFDEISKKGKKKADLFLLGSGELAERIADGEDETGGNAKQFFSGVGKGLLGLGARGGVEVAGGQQSRGGVKVAGGKDKKAGKIIGKVLSLGLGEKPKKAKKSSYGRAMKSFIGQEEDGYQVEKGRRIRRGDVVRAVMRENPGMSLGQASHYVKVNGLW
jgi:hypothetical protein